MRKFLLITICSLFVNLSFAQRDTIIIHKKDNFKILENQFFDKNGDLVKRAFLIEGNLPTSYFTKEDLFQRAIKPNSGKTIHGIGLDSIILYKNNRIIEKRYFYQRNGDSYYDQYLYEYKDDGTLKHIKSTLSELSLFTRVTYYKKGIAKLINSSPEDYIKKKYQVYMYGYDSVRTYTDNGIKKKEYYAYFPNGQLRQKRYETEGKLDSTITFRHDGTLMEKSFFYYENNSFIYDRIIQKFKPNENQPYEIDTIYFSMDFAPTNVTLNKSKSSPKVSTIDTAFSIGLRDSLFIYQRGDFKILEGRFYYKNGIVKKRVFEREGDFLNKCLNCPEDAEDRFQRGGNIPDSIYNARKLDSVIIYHADGRINEKWIDSERQRIIYDENNQLIKVQEGFEKSYRSPVRTNFEPNKLLTPTTFYDLSFLNNIVTVDAYKFAYNDRVSLKTRINTDLTIPFKLTSYAEELVEFELIPKNDIEYEGYKQVVNYADTIIFNLKYNPTKTVNNYKFTLQGTTADTTFNLNIDVNIEGYHLTKADFDKNITYELSTKSLVLYFETGGGKLLRIYKNGVLKAEGSVSQIMNEISFKGYAKGEYTLELVNLSTRQKDSITLILK